MIPLGHHGASSMTDAVVRHTKDRCFGDEVKRGYHKMGAIYATTVSQRIVMPNVIQTADKKRTKWGLFTTLLVTSLLFMMVGTSIEPDQDLLAECGEFDDVYYDDSEECQEARDQEASSGFVAGFGGLFCCGAIIVGIMSLSAGGASTRAVIVNQGYVPTQTSVQPNQQVIQTSAGLNQRTTGQMPLNATRTGQNNQQVKSVTAPAAKPSSAPSMDEIDKLAQEAKNLELARDFPKAAEMYQKAGLFAEAGRIRQTYLENEKPMVQIGQIGDSVVKDSVIMGDKQSNLCPNCGDAIQPEWKFCPSCNIPL